MRWGCNFCLSSLLKSFVSFRSIQFNFFAIQIRIGFDLIQLYPLAFRAAWFVVYLSFLIKNKSNTHLQSNCVEMHINYNSQKRLGSHRGLEINIYASIAFFSFDFFLILVFINKQRKNLRIIYDCKACNSYANW